VVKETVFDKAIYLPNSFYGIFFILIRLFSTLSFLFRNFI